MALARQWMASGAVPAMLALLAVSATAGTYQLAVGPGGVIWFTEWLTGKVGRISAGGRVTQVALPKGSAGGLGIAVRPGPHGVGRRSGRPDRQDRP